MLKKVIVNYKLQTSSGKITVEIDADADNSTAISVAKKKLEFIFRAFPSHTDPSNPPLFWI